MPSMPPLQTNLYLKLFHLYTQVYIILNLYIYLDKNGGSKGFGMFIHLLGNKNIHLDLIQNMSTEQFMLHVGFRRFLSRHGKTREIVSDNASQFKLASETFDRLWEQVMTQNDVIS